jgi:hypothetical protein
MGKRTRGERERKAHCEPLAARAAARFFKSEN